MKTYTFIVEYNDKHHTHQTVTPKSFGWALEQWIDVIAKVLSQEEKPLADTFAPLFLLDLRENLLNFPPRLINEVINVWFTAFNMMGRELRLHIVRTDQPDT